MKVQAIAVAAFSVLSVTVAHGESLRGGAPSRADEIAVSEASLLQHTIEVPEDHQNLAVKKKDADLVLLSNNLEQNDKNDARLLSNSNKPCMKVILTGTMPGPGVFNGLAAAGTLVTVGTERNACSEQKFQFDIGRGTTTRLSELGVTPKDIDALFLTHLHSDHVDDLAIFMQFRWIFNGEKIDILCSDVASQTNPNNSPTRDCNGLLENIASAYEASGEIAERFTERPFINPGGPSALANVITFAPGENVETVYESGKVKIDAIRSTHINGQASYRVTSPAGIVVISGDASNDNPDPDTRPYSTNDNVEKLADKADVLVHSAVHPIMEDSGFPAKVYNRQSSAPDIAAMAERSRVKKLVLTHMFPPIGADAPFIFPVPGGPLTESDWVDAVESGGYDGEIFIGRDLMNVLV